MAQLIKPQIKWTEQKIQLLRDQYPFGDKQKLANDLKVTKKILSYAARRFGISSQTTLKKLQCSDLVKDNPIAHYWQGFILGDGYITVKGHITITSAKKDAEHLKQIGKLIPGRFKVITHKTAYTKGDYLTFDAYDVETAQQLIKRFNIITPKTYNPPDIQYINDYDKFIPFFAGLFDADGCFDIRNGKAVSLNIEMHNSWKSVLLDIQTKLKIILNINAKVFETAKGYIKMQIFNQETLKTLKRHVTGFNIPLLERKWNSINLDKN